MTQLIKLPLPISYPTPAVMKTQVDRMLKDSRANALIENFALGCSTLMSWKR